MSLSPLSPGVFCQLLCLWPYCAGARHPPQICGRAPVHTCPACAQQLFIEASPSPRWVASGVAAVSRSRGPRTGAAPWPRALAGRREDPKVFARFFCRYPPGGPVWFGGGRAEWSSIALDLHQRAATSAPLGSQTRQTGNRLAHTLRSSPPRALGAPGSYLRDRFLSPATLRAPQKLKTRSLPQPGCRRLVLSAPWPSVHLLPAVA